MMNARSCALLAAGAASLLPIAARASDAKQYPGAACHTTSPGTTSFPWGRAEHHGVSPIHFECPVVRDATGGYIRSGWVRVVDRHYSDDVICFLQSWPASNPSSGHFSVRKSAGSSAQTQALYFGSLGTYSDAFYHLSCQVPGTYSGNASGIVSYVVDES